MRPLTRRDDTPIKCDGCPNFVGRNWYEPFSSSKPLSHENGFVFALVNNMQWNKFSSLRDSGYFSEL